MSRWPWSVVPRIRALAASGRVRFTHKALRELSALELGLDAEDCCDILASLTPGDAAEHVRSALTEEWMYVFRPPVAGVVLYLKLILRDDCIIVSFHGEEGADGD